MAAAGITALHTHIMNTEAEGGDTKTVQSTLVGVGFGSGLRTQNLRCQTQTITPVWIK